MKGRPLGDKYAWFVFPSLHLFWISSLTACLSHRILDNMPGAITTQQQHEYVEHETASARPATALRGIYHLTIPRSASNLFQSMMAKQPGFQASGYKLFKPAFSMLDQLERGPWSTWPEEDRARLNAEFEAGFEAMQDEMEAAERNVSVFFLVSLSLFLSFFLNKVE